MRFPGCLLPSTVFMPTLDPESPSPVHRCISFIFVDENAVLVERRSLAKTVGPGATGFPGGHVEAGETPEQALLREIREGWA